MRMLRRRLRRTAPEGGKLAARILAEQRLPIRASLFHRPVAATYMSVNGEMDTHFLRALVRARRWREALPAAVALDAPLAFREHRRGAALAADACGIPAPPASARMLTPELLFAPLLAFDRQGGRLGQGGGHYDRAIAALRDQGQVYVIGMGYAGQELDEIPMEPHDQRLDAILTETEFIPVAT